MKRIAFIISTSLLILVSNVETSYAFRCSGKIVSVGDTKFDVIKKCGEPDFKETWVENRISRDLFRDITPTRQKDFKRELERKDFREPLFVEEYVVIEEWTYNLGPNRFVRYLGFENGKLVKIRTGGYGY